ncbi:hypothetical protein B9P84_18175 [Citrobacter braakii]|uniref:DUF2732 family protein n=1 Tax=Citrobacter braakii TaxID=57706 RepID=UPI000B9C27C2|nr:DUF2732 family protein [Citrobacter braakii]MDL4385811.1 DUF2732 family protein [Citrobacter braakii]OXU10515.1 hypothetical protein B9P84_18175 [Citrobacter braakii]
MKKFPDPIFTPVAENIKANREDERKTLLDGFAGRLRGISQKALSQHLTPEQIYFLLNGEADRIENEAGELNHV